MHGDGSDPINIDEGEDSGWLHRYGKESGLRRQEEALTQQLADALASCEPGDRKNDELKHIIGQGAAEWFKQHNCRIRADLPYCLDSSEPWERSLIAPAVADLIDESRIHRRFRSGLSSQAMLLNLVGPLLLKGDFTPIEAALRAQGIEWPHGISRGEFEYEDPCVFNEKGPGTPTSIDLALFDSKDVPRILIEAKLTEERFGGCSKADDCPVRDANPLVDLDACYLHKQRGRTYWRVLAETGFLRGVLAIAPRCILADHYQFFREAAFAVQKGGTFILLCDARNVSLWGNDTNGRGGLFSRLRDLLPQAPRERTAAVSVQQIVAAIRETGGYGWIEEFASRYGLLDVRHDS